MDMSQLTWWNLLPSKMDPTFITLFSSSFFNFGSSPDGSGFPIRFYGMMYLFAFGTCYFMMTHLIKKEKLPITSVQLENFFTWAIAGILIGGRLGYVFFYNFGYYSQHLGEILWPFQNGQFTGIAGMSYHGGLIGCILASVFFILKYKMNWLFLANLTSIAAPLGYTWGRIGNFINGELYGRATTSSIGMLFPSDPTQQLRYPSQLFEAVGEGILLFIVMWYLRKIPVFKFQMPALYLIGYGSVRFVIEFFREPDAHLGLVLYGMSRGQELCSLMILAGVCFWIWTVRELKKNPIT